MTKRDKQKRNLQQAEKRGYKLRDKESRCSHHNTHNCIVCFCELLRRP